MSTQSLYETSSTPSHESFFWMKDRPAWNFRGYSDAGTYVVLVAREEGTDRIVVAHGKDFEAAIGDLGERLRQVPLLAAHV